MVQVLWKNSWQAVHTCKAGQRSRAQACLVPITQSLAPYLGMLLKGEGLVVTAARAVRLPLAGVGILDCAGSFPCRHVTGIGLSILLFGKQTALLPECFAIQAPFGKTRPSWHKGPGSDIQCRATTAGLPAPQPCGSLTLADWGVAFSSLECTLARLSLDMLGGRRPDRGRSSPSFSTAARLSRDRLGGLLPAYTTHSRQGVCQAVAVWSQPLQQPKPLAASLD
jgi:hypothetical protein